MSTDKCQKCGAPATTFRALRGFLKCGSFDAATGFHQSELCLERTARIKTETELAETRKKLEVSEQNSAAWHAKSIRVEEEMEKQAARANAAELKETCAGYAAQVLRRHLGLDNTKEDLCEVAELFDALTARLAELEKAQSDAARWCPDRCPITFRPFFMWIEHPEKGYVPTYGGPYDSYTIPEPDMPDEGRKTEWHDIDFFCERYDHDEGCWVDGCEDPGMRVILTDNLIEMHEVETLKARVRELEGLKLGNYQTGNAGIWLEVLLPEGTKYDSRLCNTLGEAMPRKEEK